MMPHAARRIVVCTNAARRPAYEPRGDCKCMVCGEYEQLEDVAHFHGMQGARIAALGFIKAMDDIRNGRRGCVSLGQLFD